MRKTVKQIMAAATLCCAMATPGQAATVPFESWLDGLRAEAAAKGVSAAVIDQALGDLKPIKRVIELDRRQPEFTQTFWTYLTKRVNKTRIERGRKLLAKHKDLFDAVTKKYGVPGRFLVAFWGLETNFGDYTGSFPLYGALATLAHDARRADFFRGQLLTALTLMEKGDLTADTKGSWAGALGYCQFIPSTYAAYAVDYDGDNRRDLWGSLGDVFGSAANYLQQSGWQAEWTWGREVRLPNGFDFEHAGLRVRKPLADWKALGLVRGDGRALPVADIKASLVLPQGADGPAFLVYENFRTIMRWNRSIYYAIAVGHLADRIAGAPGLSTKRPANDKAMARADMIRLQTLLNKLGFDAGKPDGIAGSGTRAAVKRFQRKALLPPDGHPSFGLLERLENVATQAER